MRWIRNGYMGEENIKKNIWTGGRVRDMDNKN
jgi:hypothetical protein